MVLGLPKVVQEWLGHSSTDVTLDAYAHVIEDMQNEAAARPTTVELLAAAGATAD